MLLVTVKRGTREHADPVAQCATCYEHEVYSAPVDKPDGMLGTGDKECITASGTGSPSRLQQMILAWSLMYLLFDTKQRAQAPYRFLGVYEHALHSQTE